MKKTKLHKTFLGTKNVPVFLSALILFNHAASNQLVARVTVWTERLTLALTTLLYIKQTWFDECYSAVHTVSSLECVVWCGVDSVVLAKNDNYIMCTHL